MIRRTPLVGHCDSSDPLILEGLHRWPGQIWVDIIDTGLLRPMSIIWREDGRQWGRLPLEMPPEAFKVTPCAAGSYVYEGEWHGERDIVIGYHNTHVEIWCVVPKLGNPRSWARASFASSGFGLAVAATTQPLV